MPNSTDMDNEKLSPEGQQAAFAEVVRQRYNSFMPKFINYLCRQYSFLSHSEAMDIYNDVFIAIYNNLQKSRIAPDTNWEAYMLKIGKNMVDKIYRAPKDGRIVSLDFDSLFDETPDDTQSRTDRLMDQISSIENTDNPYEDPELIDALNLAISHLPEKCAMIIRFFLLRQYEYGHYSHAAGIQCRCDGSQSQSAMYEAVDNGSQTIRSKAWL